MGLPTHGLMGDTANTGGSSTPKHPLNIPGYIPGSTPVAPSTPPLMWDSSNINPNVHADTQGVQGVHPAGQTLTPPPATPAPVVDPNAPKVGEKRYIGSELMTWNGTNWVSAGITSPGVPAPVNPMDAWDFNKVLEATPDQMWQYNQTISQAQAQHDLMMSQIKSQRQAANDQYKYGERAAWQQAQGGTDDLAAALSYLGLADSPATSGVGTDYINTVGEQTVNALDATRNSTLENLVYQGMQAGLTEDQARINAKITLSQPGDQNTWKQFQQVQSAQGGAQ